MNARKLSVEINLNPETFPGRRTRKLLTAPFEIHSASVLFPTP